MLNKKGVRSISFLCRNKKCTDDNREKNGYEGAKVALPIFIDEYTKECDRKVVIENKVNSLVTIEIAILTIFMPIIPFSSIKNIYFKCRCYMHFGNYCMPFIVY